MCRFRKPHAAFLALLLATKLAAVTTGVTATAATPFDAGAMHRTPANVAATPIPSLDAVADDVRSSAADATAAAGGHRPWSLPACALAVGLIVGGISGMPLNPLGGATAISIGVHLAAFAC